LASVEIRKDCLPVCAVDFWHVLLSQADNGSRMAHWAERRFVGKFQSPARQFFESASRMHRLEYEAARSAECKDAAGGRQKQCSMHLRFRRCPAVMSFAAELKIGQNEHPCCTLLQGLVLGHQP